MYRLLISDDKFHIRKGLSLSVIRQPDALAIEVGYSDVRYFQRVFKNYTGYSIKEYCRLLH